jgi:hypothetical protein
MTLEEAFFSDWFASARRWAGPLGLPLLDLAVAHLFVRGMMGPEWVARNIALTSNPALKISDSHPLFRSMHSVAPQNLVEVLEVARYLASFVDDPQRAGAVARLREAKGYLPRLFELAMAHRWKTAGALVTLEPAIPKGLADFDATIGDTRYIVECASFPGDVVSGPSNTLMYSAMKTLSKYLVVDCRTTTEVRVDSITSGDFDGAVRQAVRNAARGFTRTQSETVETAPFGSVRITRTDVGSPDHADWTSVLYLTDSSDPNGPGRHVVCVAMPRDGSDRYDRVVQKFKAECSQLGGVVEPRVVLLDLNGLTPDVHLTDLDRLSATLGDALLSEGKVAAVWIVSRGWSSQRARFMYHAVRMDNPSSTVLLPRLFQESLNALEASYDYLTDRDFPAGT